ncbi:MAG TPA: murein L,D-transpeptidase [Thermodesulfobacterium geofontis]|nr:murein L,D-transpeptidase [Thermodesulfobacterium geofontis]
MRKIWIILFLFMFILQFYSLKAETIIVIDKGRKILELKEGKKVIALYEVGLGLKSSLPKEKKGDFLTPEGLYQIVDIRTSEKYKYFLELNYPNLNDLALAYYKGLIEKEEFIKLIKVLEEFKIIENSLLGNKIGIHGGGAFKLEKKNGKVYKNYHWTKGCIALSNKDLIKLLKYVKIDQKVYILNSQKKLYDILKKFVYPTKVKPLEIFEGGLYLKLDDYTYLNFQLSEYYQGLKKLVIKRWHRGALKEKIESDEAGNFPDVEKERYFKELIIKNLGNLFKPYKHLEI